MKTKYILWSLILIVLIGGALAGVTTDLLNGVYYVSPGSATDLVSKLSICGNTSKCTIIVPSGEYDLTTTLNIGTKTRLHMMNGAWLKPQSDLDVIQINVGRYHPVRDTLSSLGDIYVNVSDVADFTSDVINIDMDGQYSDTSWGSIKAYGKLGGNGTVLHFDVKSTSDNGYFQFSDIKMIVATGFENVILADATECDGCYINGNHFNTITANDVNYILRKDGHEGMSSNIFDYIFYQDGTSRNTSGHAIIHLNSTASRNQFNGMYWDLDGAECVFNFTDTQRNFARTGGGTCCNNDCGSNTVVSPSGNYIDIWGQQYYARGITRFDSVLMHNFTATTNQGYWYNMGADPYVVDGTGGVCIGNDCSQAMTIAEDFEIYDSNPTILLRDGSGGADDFILKADWNHFSIKIEGGTSDLFNISSAGEIKANGIRSDGNGKAVCIKSDETLGTCTDAVGVGGTCTCT